MTLEDGTYSDPGGRPRTDKAARQPRRGRDSEPANMSESDCPYVTGTVTRYCTLTPFTLTDAEREAVETSFDALQYAADELGLGQGDCDRLAATLRGLLERTK
jgi:hypothetical protein